MAVGGGGYNVENTVRAWSLAWAALCGEGNSEAAVESGDSRGGLRDKRLDIDEARRRAIEQAVEAVVGVVKKKVFSYHGL